MLGYIYLRGDFVTKMHSIGINALFTTSYIYFIIFYSQEYSMLIQPNSEMIAKIMPDVIAEMLSKMKHFLFQSDSGIVPLAIFSFCLITVAFLSINLYAMNFSKFVVFSVAAGFVPTLVPVACNALLGPMVDEKYSTIWLALPIFLLIYLITFQFFFIRDYKQISK